MCVCRVNLYKYRQKVVGRLERGDQEILLFSTNITKSTSTFSLPSSSSNVSKIIITTITIMSMITIPIQRLGSGT